jgi:hypothetical protein
MDTATPTKLLIQMGVYFCKLLLFVTIVLTDLAPGVIIRFK